MQTLPSAVNVVDFSGGVGPPHHVNPILWLEILCFCFRVVSVDVRGHIVVSTSLPHKNVIAYSSGMICSPVVLGASQYLLL